MGLACPDARRQRLFLVGRLQEGDRRPRLGLRPALGRLHPVGGFDEQRRDWKPLLQRVVDRFAAVALVVVAIDAEVEVIASVDLEHPRYEYRHRVEQPRHRGVLLLRAEDRPPHRLRNRVERVATPLANP